MKTLQELLQARAELHDKQMAFLAQIEAEGNRGWTPEELKAFDDREAEINALEAQIQEKQAQEDRAAQIRARDESMRQPVNPPRRPAIHTGAFPKDGPLDNGGFHNLGELLYAMRFGDPKGRIHNLKEGTGQGGGREVPDAFKSQLRPAIRAEWSMGTGGEGGFAVGEQHSDQLLMFRPEDSIVRPRAQVIPAGDPPDSAITIPAFKQGADGVFGGVEVNWIGEGVEKPETDGNLREVKLAPQEVAAHTVVTDKLLRNWQAANPFISNLLRGATLAAEDYAFLRGDGVGKPFGMKDSAAAIAVARTAANLIGYTDVTNMVAKLLPDAQSGALWVANQSTLPQLLSMNANNQNLFVAGDATRGIPTTLFGIPLRFTGRTPGLGSKGDLMLVNCSYYLIKDGSGPFVAASEHVLFKQNKTVIKIFWNVDGKPWTLAPLTLEDGVTQVSPLVVLDVPAA